MATIMIFLATSRPNALVLSRACSMTDVLCLRRRKGRDSPVNRDQARCLRCKGREEFEASMV